MHQCRNTLGCLLGLAAYLGVATGTFAFLAWIVAERVR